MTEETKIAEPVVETTPSADTASAELLKTPETPKDPPKTFSQAELDEIIGKRLAREQRKWEREQQQKVNEAIASGQQQKGDLKLEQFDSPETYAQALAQKKAEELVRTRETQKQQQEALTEFHEREEKARDKYADYQQVAYNNDLPVTDFMAESIRQSEIGPEIAYFLGINPKEASRISKLSPLSQAKEIGKLEAKLVSDPIPARKDSKAPAPIEPVTVKSTGTKTFDTTDSRSVESMSASDWINAERERQRKKWQAKR